MAKKAKRRRPTRIQRDDPHAAADSQLPSTTSYTWTFSRRFFTAVGILAQQRGITRRELARRALKREVVEAVRSGEAVGAIFVGPIGEDPLDLHQPSRRRVTA